jgi:DNA-binding SARP family transcriptional activator
MTKSYLEVKLLGNPELRWRGHVLTSIPPKHRALIYYLAARGERVARSELEELLWGHGSSYSVRQALYQIRSLPGADGWLHVDGGVAVEAITDLAAFEAATRKELYKDALEVWLNAGPTEGRSALLSGFEFDKAQGFTTWLEVERARIEMLYLETLENRALELERADAFSEALVMVQRLLREDRLNESAYRTAMRLWYRKGQPEMAHFYFERCRRALFEELGTQPLEETLELARRPNLSGVYIQPETVSFRQALEQLPDPRGRRGQRYPLPAMLGLVVVSCLYGNHSLRDIVRFGQDHPGLLKRLGFHHLTPPGRSALSDVLGHLNVFRLWEVLDSAAPLPATAKPRGGSEEPNAVDLLGTWASEVRRTIASGTDGVQLSEVLARLGWPGLIIQTILAAIWEFLENLHFGADLGIG